MYVVVKPTVARFYYNLNRSHLTRILSLLHLASMVILLWCIVTAIMIVGEKRLTFASPVVANNYTIVRHGAMPSAGVTLVTGGPDTCSTSQCAGLCTKLGTDRCRGFLFQTVHKCDDDVMADTGRCQLISFNSAVAVVLGNAEQGPYCNSFYVISSYRAAIIAGMYALSAI